MDPLSVKVLPLTFRVMLLFVATLTLAFTVVAVLVVVVTGAPLRLRVPEVAPFRPNMRLPVPSGVIAIEEPVVLMVAAAAPEVPIFMVTFALEPIPD